jgi:DNA-binding XRE family transcriptional regulator
VYAKMDGEKVSALREERGLTRTALTEVAGISRDTLLRVERGQPVRMGIGWKVARPLGVKPWEIGELVLEGRNAYLRRFIGLEALL